MTKDERANTLCEQMSKCSIRVDELVKMAKREKDSEKLHAIANELGRVRVKKSKLSEEFDNLRS